MVLDPVVFEVNFPLLIMPYRKIFETPAPTQSYRGPDSMPTDGIGFTLSASGVLFATYMNSDGGTCWPVGYKPSPNVSSWDPVFY